MKRSMLYVILAFCMQAPILQADAQSQEIQQLLLDVQKLSTLKGILSDMKTGYEIVSKGYSTIRDISQGNFNLHEAFLDGLWLVSPAVRQYWKVPAIINDEAAILKEYKTAYNNFKQGGHFTPDEIIYLGNVYSNLVNQSLKGLQDLTNVLTANKLRMSDDERLAAIDKIHGDMQDMLTFLRSFDNNTSVLALQRAREQNEVNTMQKMYGTKP